MLKLTYTERSFYLECLTLSLEEWVAQRVILALRVGQSLSIEPSTASFLLPVDLPGVERLKAEVQRNDSEIIALSTCDVEYLEVTLWGSWLSEGSEEAVGVFVTAMSDRSEFYVHQLWQEAQACASVMSE
ncbi:alr0857 family protein [Calothrix sp. PCC 7507]|uniref:alr0857 family protein n=1 Tax=Calothrix sp. PCC 7507 TaxID=99598 RepID=UPI00029ECF2F|nr:alr0857 family protein [Calothrix sp. PCC 7507]AFY34736.1 hypothetical protein Cal7507_4365 [Calothrix sp. PCC 7507]